MKLKWLFWTGMFAIGVFFSVVYFGMKYNWVSGSKPALTTTLLNENEKTSSPAIATDQADETLSSVSSEGANGKNPVLIDEVVTTEKTNLLGSAELTIQEVVAQCQSLSETIGVPEAKLEQAISECVDRNSKHLGVQDDKVDSRELLVREQCDIAITQKDLLSNEEIKMLVDECVASMSNKQ